MKKPLYLHEMGKGLTVLADEPSVLVHMKGRALQWIPLGLIARVIVIGDVYIRKEALKLFMNNIIPVIFLDSSGRETTRIIPYRHRLSDHFSRQLMMLRDILKITDYKKMADSVRMRCQLEVIKELFKDGLFFTIKEVSEYNYQMLLKRFKPDLAEWMIVFRMVRNLFMIFIIEKILQANFYPHIGIIYGRRNYGLILDILHMLEAEIDMQTIMFFRSEDYKKGILVLKKDDKYSLSSIGIKKIIQRFEERSRYLSSVVEKIFERTLEFMGVSEI